jgi:tyrosinase
MGLSTNEPFTFSYSYFSCTKVTFRSMTVSLGLFGKVVSNIPDNPRADGYGSNPRCLRRDVNKYAAAVTTANYAYALITETKTVDGFEAVMLGTPAKKDWGVHMGGHYTIGGDPGGVSPSIRQL